MLFYPFFQVVVNWAILFSSHQVMHVVWVGLLSMFVMFLVCVLLRCPPESFLYWASSTPSPAFSVLRGNAPFRGVPSKLELPLLFPLLCFFHPVEELAFWNGPHLQTSPLRSWVGPPGPTQVAVINCFAFRRCPNFWNQVWTGRVRVGRTSH